MKWLKCVDVSTREWERERERVQERESKIKRDRAYVRVQLHLSIKFFYPEMFSSIFSSIGINFILLSSTGGNDDKKTRIKSTKELF